MAACISSCFHLSYYLNALSLYCALYLCSVFVHSTYQGRSSWYWLDSCLRLASIVFNRALVKALMFYLHNYDIFSSSNIFVSLIPLDIMSDKRFSLRASTKEERNKQWLASALKWTAGGFGPGWHPVKVLGSGSYGIAALWEFQPTPKEDLDYQVKYRRIVVKESEESASLENETAFTQLLAQYTSRVARVFGDVYTETPVDTDWVDTPEGRRSRIHVEYCEGGDLRLLIKAQRARYRGLTCAWFLANNW